MVRLDSTKTVFILGAGTSVHCHVPMMKDFLDEAYRLRRYTDFSLDKDAFDLVFEAITALNAVYAKSQLELRNIESVFAAFEMAALFGTLGTLPAGRICQLVPKLKKVILETIELKQFFRPVPAHPQIAPSLLDDLAPSEEYDRFASLVKNLTSSGHEVAVLTFNYDLGLDFAFQKRQIEYQNALEGSGHSARTTLLKLHGSLNWAQCPKCKKITVKRLTNAEIFDIQGNVGRLRPSRLIGAIHCHEADREEPFIVPPTWNKSEHYAAISPIWRQAAQKLDEAENIFIIGYSLPDTDQFFRYLYALGTMGPSRIQRLYVFNPDRAVNERYQNLLGPLAKDRYQLNPDRGVQFPEGTFTSAIDFLKRNIPVSL
ncbi:MAG: SIR2 family protein [Acidobacteriia bacterium]|nr:SIR2 family protein [Terriglobia bacterium]